MNRSEARDQFISAASKGHGVLPPVGLEEAKTKLRETAAALDSAIGLDGSERGMGRRGLSLLIAAFSLVKAQSWILPLLSGIMRLGGKTVSLVFGLLAPGKKTGRRAKCRKT
jgi:hypothetical protein